jgi:conjugal transfer mating pair stabilization protein TraN
MLSPEELAKAKQESKQMGNEISKSVHSWSKDFDTIKDAANDVAPMKIGDSNLTTDLNLSCGGGADKFIEVSAAKTTGGNYKINIAAKTMGDNSLTAYHSATVSGVCKGARNIDGRYAVGGYLVCREVKYCTDTLFNDGVREYCDSWAFSNESCVAYDLSLNKGGAIVSSLVQYPHNCVCANDYCGGGNVNSVAKGVAESIYETIAHNNPNVTISKIESDGGKYVYYKSDDPQCAIDNAIPTNYPSANYNELKAIGQAKRNEAANDPNSEYALLLDADANKLKELNEYQSEFDALINETNRSMATIDLGSGNEVTYTAYIRDENGTISALKETFTKPEVETQDARKICAVEWSEVVESNVVTDGTPTRNTEIIRRETRLCENDACPYDTAKGESLAFGKNPQNACQEDQSQTRNQVLASIAALDEIGGDVKCGGQNPSPNCDLNLDNMTIFNGFSNECRRQKAGINFCGGKDQIGGLSQAHDHEKRLAEDRDGNKCHYIDDYCSRRWTFVGCVEHKEVYCCFNSKFALAVQEQGRAQVAAYYKRIGDPAKRRDLSWGTAKSPNCKGFSAEEFQVLDFSKMDLSAVYGNISADQINRLQKSQEDAEFEEDSSEATIQRDRENDAQRVRDEWGGD